MLERIARHRKALVVLAIILVLLVGLFAYIVHEFNHWGDDMRRIDRTTEVITSTGRAFTIEYEVRTFPRTQYIAHVYLSDTYTLVGYIKLSEMYLESYSDNLKWPEPNLIEVFLSEDTECYVFFEDHLIYFYGNTHGRVRISGMNTDELSPEVIAKFLPVAERLAKSETVDSDLRNTCEVFVSNNRVDELNRMLKKYHSTDKNSIARLIAQSTQETGWNQWRTNQWEDGGFRGALMVE